jgi:hypothetical protein
MVLRSGKDRQEMKRCSGATSDLNLTRVPMQSCFSLLGKAFYSADLHQEGLEPRLLSI